jgi:ABC-type branched-subunit amino acid transport system permease subunit
MPSRIRIVGATVAGATVALVLRLWVGLPGYVAIGVGAFFGVGFLVIAATLGEESAKADAAWRSRSADILAPPPAVDASASYPAATGRTPRGPVDGETDGRGEA